jgi:hypothetical protein
MKPEKIFNGLIYAALLTSLFFFLEHLITHAGRGYEVNTELMVFYLPWLILSALSAMAVGTLFAFRSNYAN